MDASEQDSRFREWPRDHQGIILRIARANASNLADQEVLLDLLGADRIGLRLGDEDQLWPEQSTSAIVCHHPEARYFTI